MSEQKQFAHVQNPTPQVKLLMGTWTQWAPNAQQFVCVPTARHRLRGVVVCSTPAAAKANLSAPAPEIGPARSPVVTSTPAVRHATPMLPSGRRIASLHRLFSPARPERRPRTTFTDKCERRPYGPLPGRQLPPGPLPATVRCMSSVHLTGIGISGLQSQSGSSTTRTIVRCSRRCPSPGR